MPKRLASQHERPAFGEEQERRDGHLVVDVGVVLGLLLVDEDGGEGDGREGDEEAAREIDREGEDRISPQALFSSAAKGPGEKGRT